MQRKFADDFSVNIVGRIDLTKGQIQTIIRETNEKNVLVQEELRIINRKYNDKFCDVKKNLLGMDYETSIPGYDYDIPKGVRTTKIYRDTLKIFEVEVRKLQQAYDEEIASVHAATTKYFREWIPKVLSQEAY